MNNIPAGASAALSNGFTASDQNAASLQHMQLASLFSNPIAAQLLASTGLQLPSPVSAQLPPPQPFPPTSTATMNASALGALLGTQQTQPAAGGLQLSQLLADAMRLSTPVGTYPDDEDRLVNALAESEKKGTTYRRALDELHGVNNHAANLWKDYYLDHTPRINELVARKRKPLVAKKPFFNPLGHPRSGSDNVQSAGPSNSNRMHTPEPEKHSHAPVSRRTSSTTLHEPSPTRRQSKTHSKQSAGTIIIPARSPTPPTKVVRCWRGAMFTDEDQAFFVKYVNYRWKTNPSLSKAELCAELAQRCPHHSAPSWQSHWHFRREKYDKLLSSTSFLAEDNEVEKADADDLESEQSAYEQDSNGGNQTESWVDDDEEEHAAPQPEVEDLDKIAEYIVSVGAEWDELKRKDKWEPFHLQYPHRTWPAWAERYRTHKAAVDKIVAEIQRAKNSVREQRAVPSWAKDRSPQHGDAHKRNLYSDEHDEEDPRGGKRPKTERESPS